MATNLRIIHIGAGQTTVSGGNTYATMRDYLDDLTVGLPADISAAGADEDWLVLFYGDGSNPLQTVNRQSVDRDTIMDITNKITYRPAVGHAWFDNIDIENEKLTYYGPSKGVTIEILSFDTFGELTNSEAQLVVDPGFQFLISGPSNIIAAGTGPQITCSGAIVWYARAASYRNAIICRGRQNGITARVENNLLIVPDTNSTSEIMNIGSVNGAASISNNILINRDDNASITPAFELTFTSRDNRVFNNIIFGFQTAFQVRRSDLYHGNVTDGAADPAFVDPAGLVAGTIATVFREFTPGSDNPLDFDFRLLDSPTNPAVGIANFVDGDPTGPATDFYGVDRSSDGFAAGILEPVVSAVIQPTTLTVSGVTASANVAPAQAIPGSFSIIAADIGISGDIAPAIIQPGSFSSTTVAVVAGVSLSNPAPTPGALNSVAAALSMQSDLASIEGVRTGFTSGFLPALEIAADAGSLTLSSSLVQNMPALELAFNVAALGPFNHAHKIATGSLAISASVPFVIPSSTDGQSTTLSVSPLSVAASTGAIALSVGAVKESVAGLQTSFNSSVSNLNPGAVMANTAAIDASAHTLPVSGIPGSFNIDVTSLDILIDFGDAAQAPQGTRVAVSSVSINIDAATVLKRAGGVTKFADAATVDLTAHATDIDGRAGMARLNLQAFNVISSVPMPMLNREVIITFPPITDSAMSFEMTARPTLPIKFEVL